MLTNTNSALGVSEFMSKPRVYFVNGTAVAEDGDHVFKEVVAGFGLDISALKRVADIIELVPGKDNLYYLQNEGSGIDYGENYLVASQGVTAGGCKGQGGSIGAILSPIRSYNEYVENIQAIKRLLELKLDGGLDQKLLRLLFVGVCGEMEGYLNSTIIALVQGVREVFVSLREVVKVPQNVDEHLWRDAVVERIIERYNFLRLKDSKSDESKIYKKLLGYELVLSQELLDDMAWRNKMAHRVPYYSKPVYPKKEDVLAFIEHANALVESIDKQIAPYKEFWLEDL